MNLLTLLNDFPDPREEWKVKHPLSALLFPTLCAVLCGVETWSDIPDFCEVKKEWLEQYVSFDKGIPSTWTFRRIFTLLNSALLEALLRGF